MGLCFWDGMRRGSVYRAWMEIRQSVVDDGELGGDEGRIFVAGRMGVRE